jgi:hypothetical protein
VTTSDATRFTMGNTVKCTDGACGRLWRVVVDPIALTLTHLVVEPGHQSQGGRLVPLYLVSSTGPDIELSCSLAEFTALEDAEETHFLPGARGTWGYGQEEMLSWPYYGLGTGTTEVGMGGVPLGGMSVGLGLSSEAEMGTTTYDHVPAGEIQVRRGEHVQATDGPIGRVQGLVIDPADHRVTHVLLDEGHLWGQKQVAIPIGSVTGVDSGVRLDLSKDQVRDLPEVDLDHHD